MATPYFQLRRDTVTSTQDVARAEMRDLPVLVIASGQTEGRGRAGDEWMTADRALACSLALDVEPEDHRPFSLMAGVAVSRVFEDVELKWPNDIMAGTSKVGGILVERSDATLVVGLGLNLYWPDPIEGAGSIYESDPGPDMHHRVGALWGAELMSLVGSRGWPLDEYVQVSATIGSMISWDPGGKGKAVGVAPDGSLVVESEGTTDTIHSGVVRHVRDG